MRGKRIFATASIALAGALALGLSACTLFERSSSDSGFPYNGAQQGGYAGTEETWLADHDTPSTHERRLYEELVADGYNKSFAEFLKEYGIGTDETGYVNEALTSVVSIVSVFEVPRTVSSTGKLGSSGAGVIYSLNTNTGDAYIVTNYHNIYNSKSYGRETVPYISDDIGLYLYGGEMSTREIPATFLGGSMEHDIAVLSVKGSEVLRETATNTVYAREAAFANSDSLTVGETVFAIGNPDNKGISVTRGVVSVDAEYINITIADGKSIATLLEIRTDAAVNHGNSGGGLFNAQGELVGIVNARSEASGIEAFGYAIPANLALNLAQNIIDNNGSGGARIAELGIETEVEDSKGVYNDTIGKYFVEEKVAIEIQRGVASSAGVKMGDVLYSAAISRGGETILGDVITRKHKFDNLIVALRPGDTLVLTVMRSGAEGLLQFSITLSASDFKLYN